MTFVTIANWFIGELIGAVIKFENVAWLNLRLSGYLLQKAWRRHFRWYLPGVCYNFTDFIILPIMTWSGVIILDIQEKLVILTTPKNVDQCLFPTMRFVVIMKLHIVFWMIFWTNRISKKNSPHHCFDTKDISTEIDSANMGLTRPGNGPCWSLIFPLVWKEDFVRTFNGKLIENHIFDMKLSRCCRLNVENFKKKVLIWTKS